MKALKNTVQDSDKLMRHHNVYYVHLSVSDMITYYQTNSLPQ